MSSRGECDTEFLNEDELRALGVVVRGEHSYRWESGLEAEAAAPQAARQDPAARLAAARRPSVIRKLKSGEYRLYSRKVNPRTGRRRNLGTFGSRAAAEKHERAVQFFKRRG